MTRPTGLFLRLVKKIHHETEKIPHNVLKLFSLKGFRNISIHDILDAANTSKGGFYSYFASKEDLFFQALDDARRIWREKNLAQLEEILWP